jgi:protein SCO1
LNWYRAIWAAFFATVSLLGVVTGARSTEPFRLMEWPALASKPDFHLVDVNLERRGLADYRGRVSVVFFGFTNCPDVCPSELFKLSVVVKRLGPLASQVRVLIISLDPERDTPERLQFYVAAFDPGFIALTGSSADINEAASSFSIQFAKVSQGQGYTMNHSTGTYVVDKTGRLRLVATIETSIDDLVHDLKILATD